MALLAGRRLKLCSQVLAMVRGMLERGFILVLRMLITLLLQDAWPTYPTSFFPRRDLNLSERRCYHMDDETNLLPRSEPVLADIGSQSSGSVLMAE
jgi:hypothetical protein